MRDAVVLRTTAKLLMPFMMVFGLYVIFHGEAGPGGGFQGGVILAAAFILYALVNGIDKLETIVPERLTDILAALGVLIYAGTGVYTMLAGGAFLDYARITPANPEAGQAWGMTIVESGVGMTVASVMLTLFREFATEPAE